MSPLYFRSESFGPKRDITRWWLTFACSKRLSYANASFNGVLSYFVQWCTGKKILKDRGAKILLYRKVSQSRNLIDVECGRTRRFDDSIRNKIIILYGAIFFYSKAVFPSTSIRNIVAFLWKKKKKKRKVTRTTKSALIAFVSRENGQLVNCLARSEINYNYREWN